jgi:hypothetical protein
MFSGSMEKGAAMLEASIIVPFLLFTALACWDSGKILNAHVVMLQNADDMAQWASADPELEIGEYKMSYTGATAPPPPAKNPNLCPSAPGYECQKCTGASCGASCGGATSMITALCDTITKSESTGIVELLEGSVVARINFSVPVAAPDRVELILTAKFDGLFLFRNQTLQVRKLLPYLGPR